MDLILGRFADAEIATLTGHELDVLEQLLEIPDPDLYAAITGDRPLPGQLSGALFARVKATRAVDHDA